MRNARASVALGAAAVVICTTSACAGIVSVNVEGIPGSFQTWNVPLLNPGSSYVGTFSFETDDGSARVWGTFEAVCRRLGARLTLTDFGLESENHARDLNFSFDALIEYGMASGEGSAMQSFQATQDVNSGNGSIIWTKGASWDGQVLFPLSGFYRPWDLLHSTLHGSSGKLVHLSTPVELESHTTISLSAGGSFDGVYLPSSAIDWAYVPSPATISLVFAIFAVQRRRR